MRAETQRLSEIFFHARNEASEHGTFKPDRRIDIQDPVPALVQKLPDTAKKQEARSVAPSGRGIGKVAAEITQGRPAQERVTNRVGQRVAVRMTDRAFRKRDPHTPEDQLTTRGQAV